MATIDNPDLEDYGIVLQQHDGLRVYRVVQPHNHDRAASQWNPGDLTGVPFDLGVGVLTPEN